MRTRPGLRCLLSLLQDMEREEVLRTVPSWKAHQMTGDRKGTWNLFVTKNWRLTFRIEKAFGVSMDTLMRMQNSHDIAQTRKRAGEINVMRFS